MRGGASVAFRQAMAGGFILCLIEGVSILFTAIMTRRQHEFMQEMQRQELERMKSMMSRGGENPWEVGYNEQLHKGNEALDAKDHSIVDKSSKTGEDATIIDRAKSFSF